MKKILCTLLIMTALLTTVGAQERNLTYVYLTDTHIIEGDDNNQDVINCISDINTLKDIRFVVITGDLTEFGSDREIALSKKIFDKLQVPYYVIAGNHDSKWSESGCNTFLNTYGYETFAFEEEGIKFLATNSGPDMRMMPGLIPTESLVWLKKEVSKIDDNQPIIFFNHYPMNSDLINYSAALEILKPKNIQLIQGGHYHLDRVMDYEGIPGTIGRASSSKGRDGAGYNIVQIKGKNISVSEKLVGKELRKPWCTITMTEDKPFIARNNTKGSEIDYSVNDKYPQVKPVWTINENSTIGAGARISGKRVVYTTTNGYIKCTNSEDGKELWATKLGGKIYSTPAISGKYVIVGCTDNVIYALNLKSGKKLWEHHCDKSVLGSPTIFNKTVYIGASDGKFRALNLKDGLLKWVYPHIEGFIEAKAYVDKEQVVIGDWQRNLYSFDPNTGDLQWKWKVNKNSRMLSAAAVWPVKANNQIFITTPERLTYSIEATSGITIWSAEGGRESVGISQDLSTVYIKTMQGLVNAYNTETEENKKITPSVKWSVDAGVGYEISPTPVTATKTDKEGNGLVFIPTDRGEIVALSSIDGAIVWRHKVANALINYVLPLKDNQILVTSMDGTVTILEY